MDRDAVVYSIILIPVRSFTVNKCKLEERERHRKRKRRMR